MAILATQYGFDPEAILDWEPRTMQAVRMVHDYRVKESQKQR